MSKKVVFLDKDGTLVENVQYNVDPEALRLVPGAGEALRRLARLGFEFIVVTNQSGVARGYFTEDAIEAVEERLRVLLRDEGVDLLALYYCPHHPEGTVREYRARCDCRKPLPGLIQLAAWRHRIDLASSWLIGDILDDVEAGNRAGVRTVLLVNGGETEWARGPYREPQSFASSLLQAAEHIARVSSEAGKEAVA